MLRGDQLHRFSRPDMGRLLGASQPPVRAKFQRPKGHSCGRIGYVYSNTPHLLPRSSLVFSCGDIGNSRSPLATQVCSAIGCLSKGSVTHSSHVVDPVLPFVCAIVSKCLAGMWSMAPGEIALMKFQSYKPLTSCHTSAAAQYRYELQCHRHWSQWNRWYCGEDLNNLRAL